MPTEPTIAEIAAIQIREYNPKLANMFINQPFNRVAIAKAFAKGFTHVSGHDYEIGLTVIALAEMDRDERIENNR